MTKKETIKDKVEIAVHEVGLDKPFKYPPKPAKQLTWEKELTAKIATLVGVCQTKGMTVGKVRDYWNDLESFIHSLLKAQQENQKKELEKKYKDKLIEK